MREIKFRAWLKRSKEMYQVESLDFEKERAFIYTNDFDLWADFKDIILLQFTGLYDKHGKEIYEGDILTIFKDEKEISEVFYKKGCFCIRLNSIDYYLSTYGRFNLKIIGNIHENPELLKR